MARRLPWTAAWFGAFSRLMTVTHHLELTLLPHCHAIFRLPPHEKPSFIWPKLGDGTAFVSITYTHDEISGVCEEASLPASVAAQRGRRLFRVKGPLDFSLTGILASLTSPLAEAGVSIFVISTYDTDYLLVAILSAPLHFRADEPYARSRDYDLQHSRMAFRFDIEQKKVFGDVTHSISILRDATAKIAFDSVGLTIQSVSVNKAPAGFETTAEKLIVALPAAAHASDKFEIEIRYEAKPAKGLYFVLPDKDYPDRPKQIWTQGESEDTRYYLPTYDYPNDRLTTETILTVPASWITVANGKLISAGFP